MTIKHRLSLTLFGDTLASWWRIGVVVFLALCWAWPLATLVDAIINRQPPVRYVEAYALEPDVTPGGQVEIRFDVDRARICPVISVSRAIADQGGTEHVVLGYTRLSGTRPGREVYDSTITVPPTVPPGPAWYFIRINYGCNFLNYLGWPIVVESPRVPLTVWPRKDKVPIGAVPAAFYDGELLALTIIVTTMFAPLGSGRRGSFVRSGAASHRLPPSEWNENICRWGRCETDLRYHLPPGRCSPQWISSAEKPQNCGLYDMLAESWTRCQSRWRERELAKCCPGLLSELVRQMPGRNTSSLGDKQWRWGS